MSATSTYMTFLMHKETIEDIDQQLNKVEENIDCAIRKMIPDQKERNKYQGKKALKIAEELVNNAQQEANKAEDTKNQIQKELENNTENTDQSLELENAIKAFDSKQSYFEKQQLLRNQIKDFESMKSYLADRQSKLKEIQYEWVKLVDITEFPDIGTDPEMLETTTLSDDMQTFIVGIHGNESMNFNANYDYKTYLTIKTFENKTKEYAVWFGGVKKEGESTPEPTGAVGKFSFEGQLSVRITGGGVNEVRGMEITIAPSSVIRSE